jgi:hypothetical protein
MTNRAQGRSNGPGTYRKEIEMNEETKTKEEPDGEEEWLTDKAHLRELELMVSRVWELQAQILGLREHCGDINSADAVNRQAYELCKKMEHCRGAFRKEWLRRMRKGDANDNE